MQICRNYSQPNFKAMKPNQFKGIDYAVVRKFKAPVEKFNSTNDLQNWANCLLQDFSKIEFVSKFQAATLQRRFILNKWKDFLFNKEGFSPVENLFILKSVQKGLKTNNDTVPPILNNEILKQTLNEVKAQITQNKDKPFDFNKIYRLNLANYYLNDIPKEYTGWIPFLSKRKEPLNFERNVQRLKLLSDKNWCTKKDFYAESYLTTNDMHIYLEEGKPRLAVKISGVEIVEVQGEKNNTIIPKEYIEVLKKFIDKNKYYTDSIDYIIKISQNPKYMIELSYE